MTEPQQPSSLVKQITGKDRELDQRLQYAFERGGNDDAEILLALLRTNPSYLRHISATPRFLRRAKEWLAGYGHTGAADLPIVLGNAVKRSHDGRSLGTQDFLISLIELGLETGRSYEERPFSVDLLAHALEEEFDDSLSKLPRTRVALERMLSAAYTAEDFQYILALSGDHLSFRVVSVLDDYVQQGSSGLLVPQRAVLTHFKDRFGGFTENEIRELEDLLNSRSAKEIDFQRFFERHQHFLRRWDYREVYAHVTLARPEGPLIPDFILTDRELQRAAILDLKLPRPKLVRRQRNRDRFSASVIEARAQLLLYRDWFRESRNRSSLVQKVGMEIYEPHLIVIIGRASEFQDEFDRQRLRGDTRDIEVVTYDDILSFAKRRKIIIEGENSI